MAKRHPDANGGQTVDGTAVVLAVTPSRRRDLATQRDWMRWHGYNVRRYEAGQIDSAELARLTYSAKAGYEMSRDLAVEELRDEVREMQREHQAA